MKTHAYFVDPIFADLLSALGYALQAQPPVTPPIAPERDEPIPGSDGMDEDACDHCGGTGLVTTTYLWRGVECDADDQPCCVCAESRG